ncbi:putative iSMca6/ transposase/ OrfA [Synechococcus sp. A15-127]|nr:putative iSMca6/ transposase/ OrfA [Synechococcus sp. A15-127]
MGFGRWYRLLTVPEVASAATDLDLISYMQATSDARMRHGGRIPAWYLLVAAQASSTK